MDKTMDATGTTISQLERAYRAAHEGAAVIDRSPLGKLQITGRDRLDFIQRMSTNQVLELPPGQGRATVLTTAIGRMVDRLTLLIDTDEVLALTSPGQAPMVRNWLSRYIFFMDQVQLIDITSDYGLLTVYGPDAAGIVSRVAGVQAGDLPLDGWVRAAASEGTFYEAGQARVARMEPLSTANGFAVIVPAQAIPDWWTRLTGAGAAEGDEALYEVLRVEAGLPAFGREITEEYIPLEANLWNDVSFHKGCYIGQEIIARMESRGKLAKRLMSLRLSSLPPGPGPWPISVGGKDAGTLTSAVYAPDLGPIGLGFVRTAGAEAGVAVTIRTDGAEIDGTLVDLPFHR